MFFQFLKNLHSSSLSRSFSQPAWTVEGMTIVWLSLTDHKKITDGWSKTSSPLLYWSFVIGNTFLSWVVNDSCFVDLDLRWRPPVRRVPDGPPDGVVVEAEVVLAAVEVPGAAHWPRLVVGGVERRPGSQSARPTEGLGLVTVGVSFWFWDYLLCNLEPSESKQSMRRGKFNLEKRSSAKISLAGRPGTLELAKLDLLQF